MPSILFEIKNDVAIIKLNREDKMNAFNREMALRLQAVLDECNESNSVRALLITGSGKAFSAGQDLAEAADPNGPGLQKILSEQFNPIVMKVRNLKKPVVAAVNGVAAGAGANIALCCDVVICSASSYFIQAFSKIGLIPDSGGTFFLPRLIGWQKSSALMMLGDRISAEDAERLGMVYKVFPDDIFHEQSFSISVALAQMPTRALALTKEALNRSVFNSLEEQLLAEDELQSIAGATHDYAEGVNAFIQKRKPVFKGQ
jgi:2-(1,2-epoxy-1,2-dihydrophenyl)acetyl-CoA isomerase